MKEFWTCDNWDKTVTSMKAHFVRDKNRALFFNQINTTFTKIETKRDDRE